MSSSLSSYCKSGWTTYFFPGTTPKADRFSPVAVSSVRGRRHTMHTDFLAGYAGIIAKAVINGIVGSILGDTMILASAGWEHQGPRGASLLAVIAKAE